MKKAISIVPILFYGLMLLIFGSVSTFTYCNINGLGVEWMGVGMLRSMCEKHFNFMGNHASYLWQVLAVISIYFFVTLILKILQSLKKSNLLVVACVIADILNYKIISTTTMNDNIITIVIIVVMICNLLSFRRKKA